MQGIDLAAFVAEILAPARAALDVLPPTAPGEPYARRPLVRDDECEVMLATWRGGAECAPHDHADARGSVIVLAGAFTETAWFLRDGELVRGASRRWRTGEVIPVAAGGIHSMADDGSGGTTLHVYMPPICGMRVYDRARGETLTVRDDCGAWVPRDERLVASRHAWSTRA